jgi:hypothetical protein
MCPESIENCHSFGEAGASLKLNYNIFVYKLACAVQQNNQVGMITLMS